MMVADGLLPGGGGRPVSEAPDEPAPDAAGVRRAFRGSLPSWRLVLVGMWLSLVAVSLIALAQLDGLVAQRAVAGRTFSLTAMTSVGALADRGATLQSWRTLADLAAQPDGPGRWVQLYAWTDLGFAVLYGVGLAGLLLRPVLRWRQGHWWFLAAFSGLVVGAVSDLSESHELLELAAGNPGAGDLYVASLVKWSGLAVAALAAVLGRRQLGDHPRGLASRTPYGPADLSAPAGPVGRTLRAFYTHRFSLLVVVPFAVLGLASGSDILDQLPDVQRQWVDDRPGIRLAVAGTLTVVVALVVVVVGRLRSHHVAMRVLERSAPYRRPALLPWFVTAAVILGGGLVSWPLLGRWEVITPRFVIAVVVPVLIWVLSLLLRWRHRHAEPPWSPYRRPVSLAQARTTQTVGDVIGILALVIPGLGLVRAFAAPVALGGGGWNLALLGVGVGVGVLAWPASRLVGTAVGALSSTSRLSALTPGLTLDAAGQRRSRRNGWILLALGIVLFVSIGLFPRYLVEHVGVIELVLLAVTAIALPLGATLILLQGGGAPDVLSRSGTPVLATAPVMTLIVLTAVAVGLTGGDARIHGLRTLDAAPVGSSPADRTTLGAAGRGAQRTRLRRPPRGRRGPRVRPVFLLAAEGGGIRAAAWTALGADALDAAGGRCAEALMSSGASGGAVGLTVASVTGGGGRAFAGVERMAGPDALGVAVSGLIVRDPLRSVTGVPFPTWGEPGWVDRAGLMEREWEQAVPELDTPFLGGPPRVTGALVLNSTSVATHCRTLLSQVALDPSPDPRNCQTPTAPADSIDLLPTLREGCTSTVPTLRASTVALLASRFPYVTPSGVVTTCSGGSDPRTQQVVDGGYADNDGLGTVVDLAGQWLPALRTHNEDVLSGVATGPLLVPVLLYLDNGSGSDLEVDPGGRTNEVLVPLLTKGAATASLSSTDTQLHRALEAFSTTRVLGCAAPGLPAPGAGSGGSRRVPPRARRSSPGAARRSRCSTSRRDPRSRRRWAGSCRASRSRPCAAPGTTRWCRRVCRGCPPTAARTRRRSTPRVSSLTGVRRPGARTWRAGTPHRCPARGTGRCSPPCAWRRRRWARHRRAPLPAEGREGRRVRRGTGPGSPAAWAGAGAGAGRRASRRRRGCPAGSRRRRTSR